MSTHASQALGSWYRSGTVWRRQRYVDPARQRNVWQREGDREVCVLSVEARDSGASNHHSVVLKPYQDDLELLRKAVAGGGYEYSMRFRGIEFAVRPDGYIAHYIKDPHRRGNLGSIEGFFRERVFNFSYTQGPFTTTVHGQRPPG